MSRGFSTEDIIVDKIHESGTVKITVPGYSTISYMIDFDKEDIDLFNEDEIREACRNYLNNFLFKRGNNG